MKRAKTRIRVWNTLESNPGILRGDVGFFRLDDNSHLDLFVCCFLMKL